MIYRERLDDGNVRGGMVESHLAWVREHHPEWLDPIRRIVTPEVGRILADPIVFDAWYPFATLIELDRAIITLRGGGDPETARELGRFSAELNHELVADDLHDALSGAVRAHDRFEDFGSVAYERLGSKSCRISMHELRCYSKLHCWSAEGYFERLAELHGVSRVAVIEERCVCEDDVPSCEFAIDWE